MPGSPLECFERPFMQHLGVTRPVITQTAISHGSILAPRRNHRMDNPIFPKPPLGRLINTSSGLRAVSFVLLLFFGSHSGIAQPRPEHAQVLVTVVDENGIAVAAAQVAITEPGKAPLYLWTDYAGHCTFTLPQNA